MLRAVVAGAVALRDGNIGARSPQRRNKFANCRALYKSLGSL
jgi:hypothetical protein